MPVLLMIIVLLLSTGKSFAAGGAIVEPSEQTEAVSAYKQLEMTRQETSKVITEPTPLSHAFYCDSETFITLINVELVDGKHEFRISGRMKSDDLLATDWVDMMEWSHKKKVVKAKFSLYLTDSPILLIGTYNPILFSDNKHDYLLSNVFVRVGDEIKLREAHVVIAKSWLQKLKGACAHPDESIRQPIFTLDENWTLLKVFLNYYF